MPLTREQREAVADAARLVETNQVAAQPHRRGDRGYMTDGFGTFIQREFKGIDERETGRKCWEAGQKYITKRARLRRVKGVPCKVLLEDESPSNGGELDEATVEGWREEIARCEAAMKCSGLPGFHAAENLVLEDVPPELHLYGPVKRALVQLAICLGTIS